jgi:ribulose-phosphate 3-epimerase
MSVVIPAILSSSLTAIRQQLKLIEGLVDTVQIDVVDRSYAATPTWPYSGSHEEQAALTASSVLLPEWGSFKYEADLMVGAPMAAIGTWIEFGAQRVVLHAEDEKLPALVEEFTRAYGHAKEFAPDLVSLGIAIGHSTTLAAVEKVASSADFFQFMGIAHIGKQGEPFDESVLPKIAAFRKKHPEAVIQVDGGVSLETAPRLLSAGADRLVVGSALWKSENIEETLKKFEELMSSTPEA